MRGVLLVFLMICLPSGVFAQNCRKGKPCGNTCIAQDRVCRVGAGTARQAGGSTTSQAPAAAPAPLVEPADTSGTWVASARGNVYYKRSCSAARQLNRSNMRYFKTEAQAREAGYRRSETEGC